MTLLCIADQDPKTVDLVGESLAPLAPRIVHADCVDATRTAFEQNDFDLLVLSHDLPGGSSVDLMKLILETRPQLPILLLTDKSKELEAVRTLDLGITAYVARTPDIDISEQIYSFVHHMFFRLEQWRRQRDTDEALRSSERKYRNLVKTAPVCIHEIDLDGRLISMNPAGLRMMGVEEEEQIFGLRYLDVPVDEDKERIAALMDKAREGVGSTFEFGVRAGEQSLYFESSFQPVFDESGAVVKLMGVTKDITERVRAENHLRAARADAERARMEAEVARREAERANAAKSEFLAAMSHDLRTPLNAIIGFSEIMQSEMFGPLGNSRYHDYLEDIHNSGHLLVSLINDILDISRIEAGKYTMTPERIVLPSLVESCFRQVGLMALQAGVDLRVAGDDSLPEVFADKRAMIQIVNNLLTNAVKYAPDGGSVRVHLFQCGNDTVEIRVSDSGPGMSACEIATALAPFERINSKQSRKHEGSGLGLYLSANLARLNGGTLRISSERNKGTTVIVTLPLPAPELQYANAG